jgi:hypothetical protein
VYTRGLDYCVFSCIICYFSFDTESTPSAISIPIPTSIAVHRIRTRLPLISDAAVGAATTVIIAILGLLLVHRHRTTAGAKRVLWKLTAMRVMIKDTPVIPSCQQHLIRTVLTTTSTQKASPPPCSYLIISWDFYFRYTCSVQ